jgi:hypothetical protein
MELYHIVEFYSDPEQNVCERYRGLYSKIPENIIPTKHLDSFAIKAYAAKVDLEESFDIFKGELLFSTPQYWKGIERNDFT